MGQFTWLTAFRPPFTAGGIDALTRGTIARLFEDFESYTSDVNLQATWSATGSAGAPTRTTAANAVKGLRSMQTVVAGGTGTLFRALPNNTFHFPAPGRIRYLVFKSIVLTGTAALRVRLSDASDATLFKEWSFTVGTDKTVDYVIDLYSGSTGAVGGGGFLNTESYPGPISEGAAAWDHTLIDRLELRNLADGSTYRFDDIRFFYEYSLLDAIGLGTEPPSDDGADGSLQSKLRYLSNLVLQLVGTTDQYRSYGPGEVYLNNSYTFGLELIGAAEQGIPGTVEITPGNYTIDRVRDGATVNIVASTGATEAAGFISAAYTPLEDNWRPGDQLVVTFSSGTIDNDTDTAVTPTANIGIGATTVQLANAALFQVGQRVRIYDDATPNGERFTISSVDSPTQITISAGTVAAFTAANNFRIVLIERTTLQTARLTSSIAVEPEIRRQVEAWTIADYDDFDLADADGNTERWDAVYIANVDGSAAGTEGGAADINTTTAGRARVQVDPDATPTRASYAIKRDEPSKSRFFSVVSDANVVLNAGQATSTLAGLRVAKGDPDSATNFVFIAREASTTVNRITAVARFNNIAQTTQNFSTTDNAVAFKIERFGNVWNCFYSLTQYPNWQWVKLAQFEDANADMSSTTSAYLFAESGGSADAQTAVADFDNWKYYIGSGALDQLLSWIVIGSGTFTTSSATVPADTGRLEANDYWNGTLLMPVTGVVAFQPRTLIDFANAGGVFSVDLEHPFTAAPTVGDEYVILAYQFPLVPGSNSTRNNTTSDVVGNKADSADYTPTANDNSLVRLIKGVLSAFVVVEGTFTTSSATVPADTGRTEANNYWNGMLLMTVAGAVAFQPRLITGFANAGGVFTLDAQQPFTAAPGLVAYVILSPSAQLVPAVDAATNTTPAHVVGNKADTIPAMNLAPGDDSAARHLKAILERIGQTPADPDDSVLTNVGQRDDTATADSLADVTTTSIQAKLRRLLLRFSADAFSSTVQGVARTDVENMITGLAAYLSSAGAAWSVVANPGAAARDNLEQTLEDFADLLAGTTGVVTFPARAQAANGVSLAEVLRHVSEAVGEDSADNVFASTLVAENGDGSALERLEEIRGRTATGTQTITAAHGTVEQTVTDITPTRHGQIAIEFDVNTLVAAVEGGIVTVRLYNMIDGATLRIIDRANFAVASDEVHPTVSGFVQEGTTTARVTIQVNSAVSVNRAVPWRIIEAA